MPTGITPPTPVDPERWQRLNRLVLEAAELGGEARDSYLRRACGEDSELLAEAAALLARDPSTGGELDRPLFEILTDGGGGFLGQHIGPYRLVRELGRGGMGRVFLGERVDGEFDHRVAIKILKKGLDTEEIVRRFRRERQILANLDHPNFAKLLDGGTTEDSRPYFVMEYVEGPPLTRYCDEATLGIRARLELFCKVCSAVQAAHRSLVVHRDLKPSNILVNPKGEPKVLDFGIAKLLASQDDPTQTATLAGKRLMTPVYASPEQVLGEAITTASDVYSLGVLLYELLAGHRPYRLRNSSYEEICRAVCEQDPEKPSTSVSTVETVATARGKQVLSPESVSRSRDQRPKGLRRRLSGDLDNIVLMALRKEPERRYSSVVALSEDIERHLEGRPVRARKDTFFYRASKLLQRRYRELGALGLVLGLLGGFAYDRTIQQTRTAVERDRAAQISDFMVDLFELDADVQIDTQSIRRLLASGVERIDEDLRDRKLTASLLATMADAYAGIGDYEDALPLAHRSVEISEEIQDADDLWVAANRHILATVQIHLGSFAAAAENLRRVLRVREAKMPRVHMDYTHAANDLAVALMKQGKAREAEPMFREVLELQRALYGSVNEEVGLTLNNLGVLLQNSGDLAGAEPYLRENLQLKRRLLGATHPRVALAMNNLSLLLAEKGDLESAEPLMRETLQQASHFFGADHPNVAKTWSNLGFLLYRMGRQDEAEEALRESLLIRRDKLPTGHPDLYRCSVRLALVLLANGKKEEGLELSGEVVGFLRQHEPTADYRLAKAEGDLGSSLAAIGRYSLAEPLLLSSYESLEVQPDADEGDIRLALGRLVSLHTEAGDPAKAEIYGQELQGAY